MLSEQGDKGEKDCYFGEIDRDPLWLIGCPAGGEDSRGRNEGVIARLDRAIQKSSFSFSLDHPVKPDDDTKVKPDDDTKVKPDDDRQTSRMMT